MKKKVSTTDTAVTVNKARAKRPVEPVVVTITGQSGEEYRFEDGAYFLSYYLAEAMNTITDDARATEDLQRVTMEYLHDVRRKINARNGKWWDKVCLDLGIDTKKNVASYDRARRCITIEPKKKADEAE